MDRVETLLVGLLSSFILMFVGVLILTSERFSYALFIEQYILRIVAGTVLVVVGGILFHHIFEERGSPSLKKK